MIISYIPSVTRLLSHDIMQPVEGKRSDTRRVLDDVLGARGTILRVGDESIAFLSHVPEDIRYLAESEHLAEFFPFTDLVGDPDRQAVDPDTGEKLFTTSEVEVEESYQAQDGTIVEELTRLEKEVTEGWQVKSVQNRLDVNEDGVPDEFTEGFHDEWKYMFDPEVDGDGNKIYPAKYTMVEVTTGETETRPLFVTKTRKVKETVLTPVLDPLAPDEEIVKLYARFWDRTPVEVTDKDDEGKVIGKRMVTPRPLHARIAGHGVPEGYR